jgi:hypothetical protein
MPHSPRVVCQSCRERLASFDAGRLDVCPSVRVTIPPATPEGNVTIVLVCPCGARRSWLPGTFEVKDGGAATARR